MTLPVSHFDHMIEQYRDLRERNAWLWHEIERLERENRRLHEIRLRG